MASPPKFTTRPPGTAEPPASSRQRPNWSSVRHRSFSPTKSNRPLSATGSLPPGDALTATDSAVRRETSQKSQTSNRYQTQSRAENAVKCKSPSRSAHPVLCASSVKHKTLTSSKTASEWLMKTEGLWNDASNLPSWACRSPTVKKSRSLLDVHSELVVSAESSDLQAQQNIEECQADSSNSSMKTHTRSEMDESLLDTSSSNHTNIEALSNEAINENVPVSERKSSLPDVVQSHEGLLGHDETLFSDHIMKHSRESSIKPYQAVNVVVSASEPPANSSSISERSLLQIHCLNKGPRDPLSAKSCAFPSDISSKGEGSQSNVRTRSNHTDTCGNTVTFTSTVSEETSQSSSHGSHQSETTAGPAAGVPFGMSSAAREVSVTNASADIMRELTGTGYYEPRPSRAICCSYQVTQSSDSPNSVSVNTCDSSVPLTEGVNISTVPIKLPGFKETATASHLACNGSYIVVKTARHAVSVWRVAGGLSAQSLSDLLLPQPLIDCLTLQETSGSALVTCSQQILLWNVADVKQPPVVLGEEFSGVTCCHLSSDAKTTVDSTTNAEQCLLSLGVQNHVWILATAPVKHLTTLKAHESAISCIHRAGNLCAAGCEAGILKVWDITASCILYSSHVLAPHPVSTTHIDPSTWLVAAGCGEMVTVVGETAANGRWTQVAALSVGYQREKDGAGGSPRSGTANISVLSFLPVHRSSAALFGPHRLLLAVTSAGLMVFNMHTGLPVFKCPETLAEPWGDSCSSLTPGGTAVVCARTAISSNITTMTWRVTSSPGTTSGVSIGSMLEIPRNSALRPRRAGSPTKSLPPSTIDIPTTRGRPVRSSGYGTVTPRRVMFRPKTNVNRAKPASARLSLLNLPSADQRPVISPRPPSGRWVNYNCDFSRWAELEPDRPVRILREGDSLLRMAIPGDGRHLACSTSQGRSLEIARLSSAKDRLELRQNRYLLGTHGPVTSVGWSHSGDQLVAVSSAGIQLWRYSTGESLCRHASQPQQAYKTAQFFFMDEFVLAAAEDSVLVFRNTCKAAHKTQLRQVLQCRLPCRQVTHVASAVQFRSSVAVACCSDHCLRVVDLHTGQTVTTYERAHPHPAHLCRLWEGSGPVTPALPLYDLFGSVSLGDGVRFWDVRTGVLALRLATERMRSLPAGFHLSPCGRLTAAGGDAAAVSVWDVRSCRRPLCRLRTAAAGVSDVGFHPRRAALLAALIDGRVHSWCSA